MHPFIIAILVFLLWKISTILLRVQFEVAIHDHKFKRAQSLTRFLKSDDSLIAMNYLLQRLNGEQTHYESPQLTTASKEQMVLTLALAQRVGDWNQIIKDYALLNNKQAKEIYSPLYEQAHKELEKQNYLEDKQ